MSKQYWHDKLPLGKKLAPGRWRLRWKPIRRGTWNVWGHKPWAGFRDFGIQINTSDETWHTPTAILSNKRIDLHIGLWWWNIHAWVRLGIEREVKQPTCKCGAKMIHSRRDSLGINHWVCREMVESVIAGDATMHTAPFPHPVYP